MSKKIIFPLIAVFGLSVGVGAMGCQAEAHVGNAEPKAATPPPPEPPPPPPPAASSAPPAPPPPPAEKPIKTTGKAKIENGHIRIPGKIHFETDKATLKKDDKETKEILETVAQVLKENAQITKVRIEGHTDSSGDKAHNQKLSQDRADTVAKWLAETGGIDKGRLDTKGWGPDRPIKTNDTAEHKEENRRVDFKIWEMDGKATELAKNDDKWTPPAGVTMPGDKATPAAAGATPAKK
jgi:outer membrane protein OmpA-like peptidoglycan-associated protein